MEESHADELADLLVTVPEEAVEGRPSSPAR